MEEYRIRKEKKVSLLVVVILISLSVLITFQITYIAVNNKYQKALAELQDTQLLYDKLSSVDSTFRSYYIGDIDEQTLVDMVLKGYVIGTGDKYGAYFTKEEYAEVLKDSNAEYVGIGISSSYSPEYGAISVVNVVPDSPALEAGIAPGDIILKVNGKSVAELGYSVAISEIQGQEGTKLTLGLMKADGTNAEIELERRKITEYSVFERIYTSDPEIGVIHISSFDAATPAQFKAAVNNLQEKGAKKLVFDVRNNPGGNLESIDEILDFLLPEGVIIRIVDADGNEETLASDASSVDMPMVVLTNKQTASAAELFASALRDYEKAVLVGETTYGKGTMQSIIPLHDGSAISVSYRMYNPPKSPNYEGIGVEPDIKIEQTSEYVNTSILLIPEEADVQLLAAIEALNEK